MAWGTAVAQVWSLAQELLHAAGKAKKKKKKKKNQNVWSTKSKYSLWPFVEKVCQSSHHGSAEMNLTGIPEDAGLIPGLAQQVKDLMLPWAVV